MIQGGHAVTEHFELRDDQVIPKYLDKKGQVSRQHPLELLKIQVKVFQGHVGLGLELLHRCNHTLQPWISVGPDPGLPDFLLRKTSYVVKLEIQASLAKLTSRKNLIEAFPVSSFLHKAKSIASNLDLELGAHTSNFQVAKN